MTKNKCSVKIKKKGDFYEVSGTKKDCKRQFKSISVMDKSQAKEIADARRRLIKKAYKK